MNISANITGSVVAALIAGTVTFIVAVMTKEQKTSEFRQAWIDNLRIDISELVGMFLLITGAIRGKLKIKEIENRISSIKDYLNENQDLIQKYNIIEARIKLRLNPNEHNKLFTIISALHEYIRNQITDAEKADKLAEEIIEESHTILKNEWIRVKQGETVFRYTKYVSLAIIILTACFAIIADLTCF